MAKYRRSSKIILNQKFYDVDGNDINLRDATSNASCKACQCSESDSGDFIIGNSLAVGGWWMCQNKKIPMSVRNKGAVAFQTSHTRSIYASHNYTYVCDLFEESEIKQKLQIDYPVVSECIYDHGFFKDGSSFAEIAKAIEKKEVKFLGNAVCNVGAGYGIGFKGKKYMITNDAVFELLSPAVATNVGRPAGYGLVFTFDKPGFLDFFMFKMR